MKAPDTIMKTRARCGHQARLSRDRIAAGCADSVESRGRRPWRPADRGGERSVFRRRNREALRAEAFDASHKSMKKHVDGPASRGPSCLPSVLLDERSGLELAERL